MDFRRRKLVATPNEFSLRRVDRLRGAKRLRLHENQASCMAAPICGECLRKQNEARAQSHEIHYQSILLRSKKRQSFGIPMTALTMKSTSWMWMSKLT